MIDYVRRKCIHCDILIDAGNFQFQFRLVDEKLMKYLWISFNELQMLFVLMAT